MNSFELFWNNKRLQQATQTALKEFLAARCAGEIKAKDVVKKEQDLPFDVAGFAMVRLNGKKHSSPVIVGGSPEFSKTFYHVIAPADGSAAADPKTAEADLLKAVFKGVDAELKANNVNLDPKSVICLPNKMMGCWGTVTTNHSLQFSFTTPKGELTFEFPVFNDEAHNEKLFSYYGFPEQARILVVDDAPTSRKLVTYYLNAAGYQNTAECADGQEALNKLLGSRPPFDFVVADWHMPNMTGLDLLRKIRASQDIQYMPVLLVTGERNPEEVKTAIKERVSGYVVKPFDGDTFYKAMKKCAQVAAATVAALKKAG